jgi:MYXO-CTERM domain-containing protein
MIRGELMRLLKTLLVVLPLAALAATQSHDARACGGCFVGPSENSQVTGHKMVLSVSKTQTTLWDQIAYSGNPASFAWILPTKGIVKIGLSSDALFQNLEQLTQVTITAPPLNCAPPPGCYGAPTANGTGAGGADSGGVGVLAHEVVGPYETVQLMASDPNALKTWLTNHNYNLPADVAPVVDQYVAEGFNFLALKLVPGQDVSAMKPVRVTTPGASPVLPLRMVAAGTGALTSITLWVLGEGRYEPGNFPSFTITPDTLVWDWDKQSSNYAALKQAKFTASGGKSWLIDAAEPISPYQLESSLTSVASYDPKGSGYADDKGQGADKAAADDVATLFAGINKNALWVTRMHGELSRAALVTDLEVGASAKQTQVQRFMRATKSTGKTPVCPTFPPCPDTTGNGTEGGWDQWGNPKGPGSSSSVGCSTSSSGDSPALLGVAALAAAFAFARRRRQG